MKYVSIRRKLIINVTLILVLVFAAVLSAVSFVSVDESNKVLKRNEKSILNALIEKGMLLTSNNSQAMEGMVKDNAYSAIRDLVSSTVASDADILFGTFMDIDRMPWVRVTPSNPSGQLDVIATLDDEQSLWVSSLEEVDYQFTEMEGHSVYLFAAPVIVYDEILGYIQYAISNRSMLENIDSARVESEKALVKTISVILIVALTTGLIGFIAVRKMARKITKPLDALKLSAENISGGDYDRPVEVCSNDEVGILANNFDTMRITIQKKIKDLEELNQLGQTLTALPTEKEMIQLTLVSACKHAKADICVLHYFEEEKSPYIHAEQGTTLPDSIFQNIEQNLQERNPDDVITPFNLSADDESESLISVKIFESENEVGRLDLVGESDKLRYSDEDKDYFLSMMQMLKVSRNNIRLKCEIEEHNRNLEETVRQRTAALQEKTNDITNMMENMHQGLFTITEDGTIHSEYAKYLEEIFETDDIEGRVAMDLLFSKSSIGENALDQIRATIESTVGVDELMFECNQHLLIGEYSMQMDDGREKILELDWDPIVLGGEINKVMVTVRDVTELKRLEGAAAEQREELEIIGQILSLDNEKFKSFASNANSLLAKNREIIANAPDDGPLDVDALFRNMHTIKGNARTHEFAYITDDVHIAESSYDELRKNSEAKLDKEKLLVELETVQRGISRYEVINNDVLKRDEATAAIPHDHMLVEIRQIMELRSILSDLTVDVLDEKVKQSINEASKLIKSLDATRLQDLLEDVCKSARSLAKELDKPEPHIAINSQDVLINNNVSDLVRDVFTHCFRNALDHGIERPDERVAKGKTPHGHITVDATVKGSHVVMRIFDDGKGINLADLAKKAQELGKLDKSARLSPEAAAELMFLPGVSTAKKLSDISGRGVGMSAVKEFIEERGGRVEVVIKEEGARKEASADFAPFELVIEIAA